MGKNGLHPSCKACEAERFRKYYKEHTEKLKERCRKYQKEHPENNRENTLRYNRKYPERVRAKWIKDVSELKPAYIRKRIHRKYKIPYEYITDDIIKSERMIIKTNRKIRSLKNGAKNHNTKRA